MHLHGRNACILQEAGTFDNFLCLGLSKPMKEESRLMDRRAKRCSGIHRFKNSDYVFCDVEVMLMRHRQ